MEHLIKRALGGYLNGAARILPNLASRHAFQLFCYPFRTKIRNRHRTFLSGADTFSFSHGNVRLQGYRWGTGGRKVLFLHGWQSHSFRWKNYVNMLSPEKYTVFAFDAPGHGFSGGRFLTVPLYSEIISSFVREHGRMNAIVGHSIGSFSLLHALHHDASLEVDRIILMAPPGEATDFFDFFTATLRLSVRLQKLALDYFEKRVTKPISYYSAVRFARELTVPGLIIHDKDDPETPYRHAVAIHRAWQRSKLITTDGLGHNLKSRDTVATVVEYLGEADDVRTEHDSGQIETTVMRKR